MCAAVASGASTGSDTPRRAPAAAPLPPVVSGHGAHDRATWSPAAEELLVALARVEPGARLVRPSPEQPAPGARQLVFVPGTLDPVLLSSAHPRVLAAARRAGSTTAQTASMLGSRWWHALTGGAMLRDRVAVVGGTASLGEHLSEVLGRPVSYSMRIEEARTSRHPALQVFDAQGRLIAHAALGVSPASRLDLGALARALETVGSREWTHFEAPRVLARTEWEGTDVLVCSALRTPPRAPRSGRLPEPPLEAMGELSTAWTGEAVTLAEMPWMRARQQIAASLRSRTARIRFGETIERVLADARRTTWPVGAWHGDWTPSTMARSGRGSRATVQVGSWARFETGVPMGLDPCHFVVEATTARDGFTSEAVRRGLEEALRRQHGPGASVLGALYLVAVTSRELVLAEGPGGHRVADRAEVLLRTLEQWLDDRV